MKEFLKSYTTTKRRFRANSLQTYLDYQRTALGQLLQQARTEVPFHRGRIQQVDWEDFQSIPPCTKQQMQADLISTINLEMAKQAGFSTENISDFLAGFSAAKSPWLGRFAMLAETSGTSGSKGLFFRTKTELAQRDGMVLGRGAGNSLSKYIKHWRLRRAVVLGVQPGSSSFQSTVHAAKKYALFMNMRIFSSMDDVGKLAAELNEFKPHIVSCPRKYLIKLGALQLQGILKVSPLSLGTGGSRMTEEDILFLQKAFPGVRVGNLYGATECSPIASTCREGRLHQYMDGAILECMDHRGEPVPAGEFSNHVVITSLLRRFQPIIRYRLEDSVMIDPEPCPCGSVQPVLHVKGRSAPNFPIELNNGSSSEIESVRFYELLCTMDFVRHYQVLSKKLNHFEINIYFDGKEEELSTFREKYLKDVQKRFRFFFQVLGCDQKVSFEVAFHLLDPLREKDHQAFVLQH